VGYILYPRQATLTDKDSIVLAEFTNTTGDPVFDYTLRQGLAVQLQQATCHNLMFGRSQLVDSKRRDVRVVEGARLESDPGEHHLVTSKHFVAQVIQHAGAASDIRPLSMKSWLGMSVRMSRTTDPPERVPRSSSHVTQSF
jgi:hypothetical protein